MKTKLLRRLRKKANKKYKLIKCKKGYIIIIDNRIGLERNWGEILGHEYALMIFRDKYIHPFIKKELLKIKTRKAKKKHEKTK